jgi:hypothetical protein
VGVVVVGACGEDQDFQQFLNRLLRMKAEDSTGQREGKDELIVR